MCTPRLRAAARPSLARFTILWRSSSAKALGKAMKPRPMGVVKMRGRPRGSTNERTKTPLRKLADQYGAEVIRQLFTLATTAESDAVRIMACREILDRAYGKPEQAIAEEVGVGMSKELREFIEHCEGMQGNEEAAS
jgi:hypothetical protein